jgi:hypothetical protein
MVHFDHEELLDLLVGLFLLVISLLLIGFFMARMARDEKDDYEVVNILSGCCCSKKGKGMDQHREFATLNDLLLEVDQDETACVLKQERKLSSTTIGTILGRKESIDLCETDHEDNNPRNRQRTHHGDDSDSGSPTFSLDTVFPSILQESSSFIKTKTSNSTPTEINEPLLRVQNQ